MHKFVRFKEISFKSKKLFSGCKQINFHRNQKYTIYSEYERKHRTHFQIDLHHFKLYVKFFE